MIRILLRAIRTTLQRTSPGAGPGDQLGAVSFLHRFGSTPRSTRNSTSTSSSSTASSPRARRAVTFHEATHRTADDVHRLQRTVQRRALRLFQRRGLLDDHTVADMLTWQAAGGFSLDASVRIDGSDRAGRERLPRYCARPPFAATSPDGAGTPHAPAPPQIERLEPHRPDAPQRTAARSRWARLLARIYEVFPLRCPGYGAEMHILAFLTAAEPVDVILRHLGLPTTPATPLTRTRSAPARPRLRRRPRPRSDAPAFDPTEPEPVPDFDFDQSRRA